MKFLLKASLFLLATTTPLLSAQQTKTVLIQDPIWNMPAARVAIPAGWRFDSIATHPTGCALPHYDFKFTAEAPDGSMNVSKLPEIQFSYSANPQMNASATQGGCLVASSFQDFLTRIAAPGLHPGAKVVEIGHDPNSNQFVAQMTQRDQQAADQRRHSNGMREEVHDDVYIMFLTYTFQGRPYASMITANFNCDRIISPSIQLDTTNCMVSNVLDYRVPDSRKDDILKLIPRLTPEENPQWADRVKQVVDQQYQQNMQQLAASVAANNKQMTDIHNQSMQMIKGYAQASDATHRQNEIYHQSNVRAAQAIGDHQTMTNSTTGQSYELSDQYGHTYQNTTDGTILQTNSAYGPGAASAWTELAPR